MRAEQRKPRQLMLGDRLVRRAPSRRRVAVLAAVAEFAFMSVGMTIAASSLQVLELGFRVTAVARHRLMVARQRVARDFMIERYVRFYCAPRLGRMAVHTIDAECSVRTLH